LGSFHGTDIQEFYPLFEDTDYVGTDALSGSSLSPYELTSLTELFTVNFAYNLNPNFLRGVNLKVDSALANISWPRWTNDTSTDSTLRLLTLEDPKNLTIGSDDYRVDAMEILGMLQAELGL
jgi:acetylcholinesterase